MENFNSFGLPDAIIHKLEHLNFTKPTPIQEKAIPVALEGKDILASAQTGTGKTAAFGIPLITKLITDDNAYALVMAPTRELAVQVHKSLVDILSKQSRVKTALLIGGESISKQFNQLKNNPRLIVGTPGRINDHLRRRSLRLDKISFLVLDETDRMLDMGFTVQIEEILNHVKLQPQTLLFSATFPSNIKKITQKYLKDPVYITVGKPSTPAIKVKQESIKVTQENKYPQLLKEFGSRAGSIIVFVKTKHGADKLASKIKKEGHSAEAIHGDLRHNKREKVIRDFRASKHRILVATDVAARGLDIPHIEHVINYDLPQNPEDYIHRIGRTGRAEAEGEAICFITNADGEKWNAIQKLINPDFKPEKLASNSNGGKKKRSNSFGKRRSGGFGGNNEGGNRGKNFKGKKRFSKGGSSKGNFGGSKKAA